MKAEHLALVALSLVVGASPALAESNHEISVLNGALLPKANSMVSGVAFRQVWDAGFATTAGCLVGRTDPMLADTLVLVPVTVTTTWPLYVGGAFDGYRLTGSAGTSWAAALSVVGGIRVQIYQATVIAEAHAPIIPLGGLSGISDRLTFAMAGLGWRF